MLDALPISPISAPSGEADNPRAAKTGGADDIRPSPRGGAGAKGNYHPKPKTIRPPANIPSGADMFLKTGIVKENVKAIYKDYPSTRGDDRLLIWRYLRRHCPQVRLTFAQFDALRSIPSFESIRRRVQELRKEIP